MRELSQFKLFDSHFHIIDPVFPLIENQGFLPDYFTCDDYLKRLQSYDLVGGTVVSGSFQGYDQTYMKSALKKLGPQYVGVTQLPYATADEQILDLNRIGVRGVRFNLKRGLVSDLGQLSDFAKRIYDLAKWHVELYVDAKDLDDLLGTIVNLPAASIAHLGLSREGLSNLIYLADQGVRIKASRFGCLNFDPGEAINKIVKANPDVLMFGTDLPSTRNPKPFEDNDVLLVFEGLNKNLSKKILHENAIKFYNPCRTPQLS